LRPRCAPPFAPSRRHPLPFERPRQLPPVMPRVERLKHEIVQDSLNRRLAVAFQERLNTISSPERRLERGSPACGSGTMLAFVPGYAYRTDTTTGADLARQRRILARLGCPTTLVPTDELAPSSGTPESWPLSYAGSRGSCSISPLDGNGDWPVGCRFDSYAAHCGAGQRMGKCETGRRRGQPVLFFGTWRNRGRKIGILARCSPYVCGRLAAGLRSGARRRSLNGQVHHGRLRLRWRWFLTDWLAVASRSRLPNVVTSNRVVGCGASRSC
jgi:hypothetical protein